MLAYLSIHTQNIIAIGANYLVLIIMLHWFYLSFSNAFQEVLLNSTRQVLCAVDSFLELAFAIFKDSLKQTCLLMAMNFFNLC